jgi:hypothetical protein
MEKLLYKIKRTCFYYMDDASDRERFWFLFITNIIFIILIIFMFFHVVLPLTTFVIFITSWEIYEYIYMGFNSEYTIDQITRFVSKHACPPMHCGRIIYNIFAYSLPTINNDIFIFNFQSYTLNNIIPFYLTIVLIIFIILFTIVKFNFFKNISISILFNNINNYTINVLNKIEFNSFWEKIKNKFFN